MTVATIGAVLAAVWAVSLLFFAALCIGELAESARADGLLPSDSYPPDVAPSIREALAEDDDFWLWQVENGWAAR